MTQVKFHFVLADGTPVSNTRFQVTLPKGAYQAVDSGVYLPSKITAETNADGKATLDLEPLARFQYTVAIADWKTGSSIKHKFYVPDSPTPQNLIDLVSLGDQDQYDFKQETIDLIINAKADTRNFREEAQTARDTALSHANTALTHEQGAEAAEGRSEARAIETLGYRNDVYDTRTAMVLLKSDMDGVASAVNSDRTAVASMRDTINARVLEVNSIIANELDPKIAQAQGQIAELETVRTNLETKLLEIDGQIETINGQYTYIGEQAALIDSKVAAFDSDVASQIAAVESAAATELASIQTQRTYIQDTLIPQITATETSIQAVYNEAVSLRDTLVTELNTMNSKLATVEGLQTDLTSQLNSIDTKITTEIDPKVQQVSDDAAAVSADKDTVVTKAGEVDQLVINLAFDQNWVSTQRNYIEERVNYFETQVATLLNDVSSIDTEVQYIQSQRDYFDNTLIPQLNSIKADVEAAGADITGVTDELFLLSTNGGAIFTKEWPTLTTATTRVVDVSQESTHYMTIGAGANMDLDFTGWPNNATKYIVIVFTNAGRGTIQWPASMVWQTRGSVVPGFKDNGMDTVILWASPSIKQSAGGPLIFGAKVGR